MSLTAELLKSIQPIDPSTGDRAANNEALRRRDRMMGLRLRLRKRAEEALAKLPSGSLPARVYIGAGVVAYIGYRNDCGSWDIRFS